MARWDKFRDYWESIGKPEIEFQVDYDYWNDDLSEDQELDDDVKKALDSLNEVLRKRPPVSWTPGKYRPIFKSQY